MTCRVRVEPVGCLPSTPSLNAVETGEETAGAAAGASEETMEGKLQDIVHPLMLKLKAELMEEISEVRIEIASVQRDFQQSLSEIKGPKKAKVAHAGSDAVQVFAPEVQKAHSHREAIASVQEDPQYSLA